jgi:hypothetical protein
VHCVSREALVLLLAALNESGSPADLVLLRVPRAEALAAPSAGLVAATLIGGAIGPAT